MVPISFVLIAQLVLPLNLIDCVYLYLGVVGATVIHPPHSTAMEECGFEESQFLPLGLFHSVLAALICYHWLIRVLVL
jgi:hypothetical protein